MDCSLMCIHVSITEYAIIWCIILNAIVNGREKKKTGEVYKETLILRGNKNLRVVNFVVIQCELHYTHQ